MQYILFWSEPTSQPAHNVVLTFWRYFNVHTTSLSRRVTSKASDLQNICSWDMISWKIVCFLTIEWYIIPPWMVLLQNLKKLSWKFWCALGFPGKFDIKNCVSKSKVPEISLYNCPYKSFALKQLWSNYENSNLIRLDNISFSFCERPIYIYFLNCHY